MNLRFLGLIAVLVAVAIYYYAGTPAERPVGESSEPVPSASVVPPKAEEVLRYIDAHHRAPDGYEGGRTFYNLGDEGKRPLPIKDDGGRPIRYQEWDIYPKRAGQNRGAKRLVTGSDGSAYYTADHYRSFTKIR